MPWSVFVTVCCCAWSGWQCGVRMHTLPPTLPQPACKLRVTCLGSERPACIPILNPPRAPPCVLQAQRQHRQELASVLQDASQHEADSVEAALAAERLR